MLATQRSHQEVDGLEKRQLGSHRGTFQFGAAQDVLEEFQLPLDHWNDVCHLVGQGQDLVQELAACLEAQALWDRPDLVTNTNFSSQLFSHLYTMPINQIFLEFLSIFLEFRDGLCSGKTWQFVSF